MKNKRILCIFIFILILISFAFLVLQSEIISADVNGNQVPSEVGAAGLGGVGEDINKVQDFGQKVSYGKWDYLEQEWKKVFLNNSFVAAVDGFLKKCNFLFVALFGEDYTMSPGLLCVILLWVFFLINFSRMIEMFSIFSSKIVANVIGLGLTVALAQTGFLSLIVKGLGWLVLSPESSWLRFLIFCGVCVFFIFVSYLMKAFEEERKKAEEAGEKEKEKANRGILQAWADALGSSPLKKK